MGYDNYTRIRRQLDKMLDFRGNTMRGERRNLTWPNILNTPLSAPVQPGRLDREEAAKLAEDNDRILYVVYSYNTPIAWITHGADKLRDPFTVYVTKQQFSVTTGRHQDLCREWL